MGDSGIRLSDLMVSLSMATDLGFGQPPEHMARSARIGMISPKTVSNHVEHVYSKLGVSNRTGAAMYAMQYGIVGSGTPRGL